MKTEAIVFFSLFFLVFLAGCGGRKFATVDEAKSYIANAENGLSKTRTVNDVNLTVTYYPCALLFKDDVEGLQGCDHMHYLLFRIAREKREIETFYAADPNQFQQVVQYLSNDIINDVKVFTGDVAAEVVDASYHRSFGMAEGSDVLISFMCSNSKINSNLTFEFNDRLFRTGISKFVIEGNKINKLTSTLEL